VVVSRGVLQASILVLAAVFLGSGFVAGKVLLRSVPPIALVGWRFVAAAVVVGAIAAVVDRPGWRVPPLRVALIGLLQTAAVMSLLYTGMRVLLAGTSAVLLFTNPLWVAVMAAAVLGERLSRAAVVGLLVGVAGVVAVLGGVRGSAHIADDALVLGAAVAWATATVLATRLPEGASTWWVSAGQMAVGGVVLLVASLVVHQRFPLDLSAADWGLFGWLTVAGTAGGFGLWLVGLRMGGATRSSVYLFLVPLFAVVASALLLGESFSWLQALGGAGVLAALVLVGAEPEVVELPE